MTWTDTIINWVRRTVMSVYQDYGPGYRRPGTAGPDMDRRPITEANLVTRG